MDRRLNTHTATICKTPKGMNRDTSLFLVHCMGLRKRGKERLET